MKLSKWAFWALALLSLMVASCSSSAKGKAGGTNSGGTTGVTSSVGSTATAGGTIDRNANFTIVYPTFPPTGVDPGQSPSSNLIEYWGPIYDTLTQLAQDPKTSVLGIKPMLATSWTYSDDSKTLTLQLRPGVTFHDGTPMDATAVKASLEHNMSNKVLPIVSSPLSSIASIDVLSPMTVQLTLSRPNPSLPSVLLGAPGVIYNPKVLADPSVNLSTSPPTDAGTGPYVLSSFIPNDSAVYTRAPGTYWDPTAGNFARMTLRVISDPNAASSAFRSGQADMVSLSATAISPLVSFANSNNDNLNLQTLATVAPTLYINPQRVSAKVRQAMADAVDRQSIAQNVYQGYAQTRTQFWPVGTPDSYNPSYVSPYPFDLQKAKALVAQAGTIPTLKMIYVTGVYDLAAESLQGQFAAAGIKVTLQPLTASQVTAQFASGAADLALGQIASFADPAAIVGYVIQTGFKVGNGDPTLAGLVTASQAALTPDQRTAAYQNINNYIISNTYAIPVVSPTFSNMASKKFINTTFMPWAAQSGPLIRYVAKLK